MRKMTNFAGYFGTARMLVGIGTVLCRPFTKAFLLLVFTLVV